MSDSLRVEWKECPFSPSFLHLLEGLSGIYLIWEEKLKTVLYVGKGDLSECVNNHLTNKEDPGYPIPRNKVSVIYTEVREENQSGVRNFLIEEFNPTLQQDRPNVFRRITRVNLPILD